MIHEEISLPQNNIIERHISYGGYHAPNIINAGAAIKKRAAFLNVNKHALHTLDQSTVSNAKVSTPFKTIHEHQLISHLWW